MSSALHSYFPAGVDAFHFTDVAPRLTSDTATCSGLRLPPIFRAVSRWRFSPVLAHETRSIASAAAKGSFTFGVMLFLSKLAQFIISAGCIWMHRQQPAAQKLPSDPSKFLRRPEFSDFQLAVMTRSAPINGAALRVLDFAASGVASQAVRVAVIRAFATVRFAVGRAGSCIGRSVAVV
jgi:hypothetical protein